ncbi:hypothetical protein FACS1894172_07980 [Spirochaetia bacterium]|nr:hypothetical protein FACS1894164_05940 [Spirochaetia bacterium]GHU32045.1 hypothetical protein FACS1894172_07980 [Spirochaetia bacterium]
MKKIMFAHDWLIAMALIVFTSGALAAQGLDFSGTLDSRLLGSAGAGAAPDFSMGFETWANLRFQTKLRDYASIYGAVNLIAATGNIAAAAVSTSTAYVSGENYAAALELERLYFRIRGEALQLDTGLLRIPLGYSLVWGPTDFLNPRSPLLPDARPRGVLGASFSAYPTDTLKFLAFAAAPKDPLISDGFIAGVGAEKHWDKASLQGFYAYESPEDPYTWGRHRIGFSLKADIELGFVADALYTYDYEAKTTIDGLAAAVGFDYSFFKGDLSLLAEYLYSGENSSIAESMGLQHRHYIAMTAVYSINDYTRLNLTAMASLEDVSFLPIFGVEYEPFQGMTLNLSCQVPLDRDLFTGRGNHGELGPVKTGSHALITLKTRLKF